MTVLYITRGDTAILRIAATDADCLPIDLTDDAIEFTIKRSRADADSAAIFEGSLSGGAITIVGDLSDGLFDVTVPRANTLLLRSGRAYFWDVKLINAINQVFTISAGIILATDTARQAVP